MKGTGFDPRCLPVGIPEQAALTPQRLLTNDIYIKETQKLLWEKKTVGRAVATRLCCPRCAPTDRFDVTL